MSWNSLKKIKPLRDTFNFILGWINGTHKLIKGKYLSVLFYLFLIFILFFLISTGLLYSWNNYLPDSWGFKKFHPFPDLFAKNKNETENYLMKKTLTSDFDFEKDYSKWNSFDNLIFINDERKIVRPKLTENFSASRTIFFNQAVNPDFKATFKFKPLDEEEISIGISYGYIFRVLVGDGDYNKVLLQKNIKPFKTNLATNDWREVKEETEKKWIASNQGLEPGKDVEIILFSRPEEGTSLIHINLILKGFLKGETKMDEFDFNYTVDVGSNSSKLNKMIGVEFLDTKEKNIKTQLNYFELVPF